MIEGIGDVVVIQATLETGLAVHVPLSIKEHELVCVNKPVKWQPEPDREGEPTSSR